MHVQDTLLTKSHKLIYLSIVFIPTTFPDDFESSPLKLDDLQEKDRVAMGNKVSDMVDKVRKAQLPTSSMDSESCRLLPSNI